MRVTQRHSHTVGARSLLTLQSVIQHALKMTHVLLRVQVCRSHVNYTCTTVDSLQRQAAHIAVRVLYNKQARSHEGCYAKRKAARLLFCIIHKHVLNLLLVGDRGQDGVLAG